MSDTENIQDLINERNNQNKRIEQLVLEIDRLINLNKQLVEECQRLDDEETRLNNIINELEKEIDIAIKELQPNELVNGINLLKNIKFTLKELKENK